MYTAITRHNNNISYGRGVDRAFTVGDFKTGRRDGDRPGGRTDGWDGMGRDEKESSEPSPRIHLILQIGLRGCEVDHDDDFHPLCVHRRRRCHTIMEPYRSGGQVGRPPI